MTARVLLTDRDSDDAVVVTPRGQLVVAPLSYSTPVTKQLAVADTAYNFIEPLAGHFIVITDIIASAGKTVSNTTPADVVVYQASAIDTATVDDVIVQPQLLRGASSPLTGMNLEVPAGKWVNAKTDDAAVLLTIMFYRVKL